MDKLKAKNQEDVSLDKKNDTFDKVIFWKKIYNVKWNQRFNWFFDKISLLEQNDDIKSDISISVVKDLDVKVLYWLQIFLSAVIATLGLLQNSVAVVIGAMLIAPFFVPLQGLSFSIAEGRGRLFWKSLVVLVLSTLLSFLVAYFIAFLIPLKIQTGEMLSRVSPNILDLFIASSSAIIALLALAYKKLSQSVAGVAMAASLMPPLCVVGIQVGFMEWNLALGALLLYSTNIVAIVLVGVLVFLLFGFHPHREKSYSVVTKTVFLVFVTLMLSFPLMASIRSEQEKLGLYRQTESVLNEGVNLFFTNTGMISGLDVLNNNQKLHIKADLRLEENILLFQEDLDKFRSYIELSLDREVDLVLNIIRTASLKDRTPEQEIIKNEILEVVKFYFENTWFENAILIRGDVYFDDKYSLRVLYALKDSVDLDLNTKNVFESEIKEIVNEVEISYVLINPDIVDLNQTLETNKLDVNLQNYFRNGLPDEWSLLSSKFTSLKLNNDNFYRFDLVLKVPQQLNTDDGKILIKEELEGLRDNFRREFFMSGSLILGYELFFSDYSGQID